MSDGSSVPRRQLGRSLRQARERAGWGLEASAQELEWSRAKMYRIEGGQVAVRSHDVALICRLYEVPDELTEALVALARESKSKGWWHSYGDIIPSWFELYVGLEASATHLRQYEPSFVPGLLQTPDYYVDIIRSFLPGADDDEVARRVGLRMRRQGLLDRRRPLPPVLDVVLDEAAVRRRIGTAQVWRQQMRRLLAETERARVSVRIVPMGCGPYAALQAGPTVIMSFVAPEPTTVYCEGLTGALYLDREHEVKRYEQAWSQLEERALSQEASMAAIEKFIKEG